MTFQHRGELRADPGIAPGERNIDPPKRRSIWPSIAVVAAASAFGGVIWYAYHQGHEDGRPGLPPLVKAEPGPTKVKPDNPGGQEIPFQDSTVYDRLNQNGQKPVIEKLLPPPEEPVDAPAAGRRPPMPAVGSAIRRPLSQPPQHMPLRRLSNRDGAAAAAGQRRCADRAGAVARRDRHPAACCGATEAGAGRATAACRRRDSETRARQSSAADKYRRLDRRRRQSARARDESCCQWRLLSPSA